MDASADYDLLVIGGGINGCGIARDAAGRGLRVLLVEQHDLAQHTSSASSKLIHGGLRYLEQYEFRLVHEALAEREILLNAAPHLVHPMRFVMPHVPELRPAWMIRVGLFLYDTLARRHLLPGSQGIDLSVPPYHDGLRAGLRKGFIYSDCWVDDARLVVATARGAVDLGAAVWPRTRFIAGRREGAYWRVTLGGTQRGERTLTARALVNVTGPWAGDFLTNHLDLASSDRLKLVRGSHIVVPALYQGSHAFILQNDDRRVVFAYPYEGRYTLIGTTDETHHGDPGDCAASAAEVDYLCRAANRYFVRQLTPADVVWRYSGVRPLMDDGSGDPSKISRDYTFHIAGDAGQAPVLSVFGGKITTYRKLAEHALAQLADYFPQMTAAWTDATPLPGGKLDGQSLESWLPRLHAAYPQMPADTLDALARRHGNLTHEVLGDAALPADLGTCFGPHLYAREVDYMMAREWATTDDDILWRRTKAGLHTNPAQQQALHAYMAVHAIRTP